MNATLGGNKSGDIAEAYGNAATAKASVIKAKVGPTKYESGWPFFRWPRQRIYIHLSCFQVYYFDTFT